MCPIVTNFRPFPPFSGLRAAPPPLSCCPLRDGEPKISAQSKRGEQNCQGLSMFSRPVPEPPEDRDLAHPPGGESQNMLSRGLWMKLNLSNMSMLPWDQKEPEGALLVDTVPEGWVPATSAVCDTPTLVRATGLCWCFDFPASPHTNIPQVWRFNVGEERLQLISWAKGFHSFLAGEPLIQTKILSGSWSGATWLRRTGTCIGHYWTRLACQEMPPGIQMEFLPTCSTLLAALLFCIFLR